MTLALTFVRHLYSTNNFALLQIYLQQNEDHKLLNRLSNNFTRLSLI